MKKYFFLMLLLTTLLLAACTNEKKQSLERFYKDAKIENVDKVIIQNGSTGNSKTITNSDQIEEFLTLVKEVTFTPQENQEKRDGMLYGITLVDGKKEFTFTLNEIDNTYYDSNPDIHPIVENFYKQLDIAEK